MLSEKLQNAVLSFANPKTNHEKEAAQLLRVYNGKPELLITLLRFLAFVDTLTHQSVAVSNSAKVTRSGSENESVIERIYLKCMRHALSVWHCNFCVLHEYSGQNTVLKSEALVILGLCGLGITVTGFSGGNVIKAGRTTPERGKT